MFDLQCVDFQIGCQTRRQEYTPAGPAKVRARGSGRACPPKVRLLGPLESKETSGHSIELAKEMPWFRRGEIGVAEGVKKLEG